MRRELREARMKRNEERYTREQVRGKRKGKRKA